MPMQLLALPALQDNYIWLLQHGRQALVVDPAEAAPAIAALRAHHLELAAILVTHHHADHTAGVGTLFAQCGHTGTQVYLPAAEDIASAHYHQVPAQHIQRISAGNGIHTAGLHIDVLDVPGHTAGHVAYYCHPTPTATDAPVLFCGDVLFCGGCGRLFEGTPAQMLASLQQLARLPEHTRVCCAHEYTLSNLRFALAVEPDNVTLAQHLLHCQKLREQHQPTLPSTIGLELHINPFLRTSLPAIAQRVRQHASLPENSDETAIFAALRDWKNHF